MDDDPAAPTGGPAHPPRRPGSGGRAPAGTHEVVLRDGSRIWVRPILPEDRQRIVDGFAALSARSRYLRFHTHVQRLSAAQLDYLVDVDHVDHEALVAVDPDVEGQPGVAVARYIRLAEDPAIAEAAITVADDRQGVGVGTAMVGLLERAAHARGIRTFRNYVLAENDAMLEIFRQLGGRIELDGPGLYRVDVPVPAPDEAQPDTPAGRWVSSVARQQAVHPERWADPLIWLIRKVAGDG
jgi:GNAT superfamily N-acetyltransferase